MQSAVSSNVLPSSSSVCPKIPATPSPKQPSHRSLIFDHHHPLSSSATASTSTSAVRPSTSTGSLSSTNTTPSSDAMSSPADSPPTSAARLSDMATSGAAGASSAARRTISSDSDDGDIDYSLCSMEDDDDCFYTAAAAAAATGDSGLLSYSNHRLPYMYSADELPVFRCQNMSPTSRSISPIDAHHHDDTLFNFSMSPCESPCADLNDDDGLMAEDTAAGGAMAVDHISLEEIHARLAGGGGSLSHNNTSGSESDDSGADPTAPMCGTPLGKRPKLQTIVEGVFLETPPRSRAQRGAWRVATQSIGKFVEDQRQRRYDAMVDGGDGGCDGDDEAADDGDDELCMDEELDDEGDATGAVGGDGAMMDSDMQVDRMRNSFQKKLNMC